MNIDRIARMGYLARAFVYLLMGGFALLLTFGNSEGATTDPKGALQKLMEQPLGSVLLFILAVGLFCYALWRFVEAYKDPDHAGKGFKGWITRLGYSFGGITHLLLGVYAVKLIFSLNSKAGMNEKSIAHWLLTKPFGQALTWAVGLVIVGFGLSQLYIGFKAKFAKKLDLPSENRSLLCNVCKFGLISRGLVFMLIGGFFIQAARRYNSREAGGIAQAWKVLREQPAGDTLILVVSLGFIAFAIYGLLESVYQKPTGIRLQT